MKSYFQQSVDSTLALAESSPQTLGDQLTGDRSQYGWNDDSSPAPKQTAQNSLTTASGLPISRIVQGTKLYQQIMAMSDKNLAHSLNRTRVPINDQQRTPMRQEYLARKLVPGMKVDRNALWNDVAQSVQRTGASALGTPLVDTSNVLRLADDGSDDEAGSWLDDTDGERTFNINHAGGSNDDKESLVRAFAGKHGADVNFINHSDEGGDHVLRYDAEPRDGEAVDADAMHRDVCDSINQLDGCDDDELDE